MSGRIRRDIPVLKRDKHWADWAIVSYVCWAGKPPDNLSWAYAQEACVRVIERARAAEERGE